MIINSDGAEMRTALRDRPGCSKPPNADRPPRQVWMQEHTTVEDGLETTEHILNASEVLV